MTEWPQPGHRFPVTDGGVIADGVQYTRKEWALKQEIERLKLAKAQQTAQADLRSAENVKLRHALKGIAEFCSGDDTTLGAIARLAHIRNTVDQAMRRDEQKGDKDGQ